MNEASPQRLRERPHWGQVARLFHWIRICWRWIWGCCWLLLQAAEVLLLVAAIVIGALSWRLAQGPWPQPWLARRLTAAGEASAPAGVRIAVDHAAIAWEGFSEGGGPPLDIRLRGIRAVDRDGHVILDVPLARIALALTPLLLGRLAPRFVAIDRPHIVIARAANGGITVQLGHLSAATPMMPSSALKSFYEAYAGGLKPARPARGGLVLAELRRVMITRAAVTLIDRRLGEVWRSRDARITIDHAAGQLSGGISTQLALGNLATTLSGRFTVGAEGGRIEAALAAIDPAALAAAVPAFAPLARIDAPLKPQLVLTLGRGLEPQRFFLSLGLGAGSLRLGTGQVAIADGAVLTQGDRRQIALSRLRLDLVGPDGAAGPRISGSGTISLAEGVFTHLALKADRVNFADLARYWPKGIAHHTRHWVTTHITTGIARDARLDLTLLAPRLAAKPALVSVHGRVEGSGLTVHWVEELPPLTQGEAVLSISDPDRITITATAGRERGLVLRGGTITITGLTQRDQQADVAVRLSGSVSETVALLGAPKFDLLARSPLPLAGAAGMVTAEVTAKVPLSTRLKFNEVLISVAADLSSLVLPRLGIGPELSQGRVHLAANNQGLELSGSADLAGIGVNLSGRMDFHPSSLDAVAFSLAVSGRAEAAALARADIPTGGLVGGPVGFTARYQRRHDSFVTLGVAADLVQAGISFPPLAWSKPPGSPAQLEARLALDPEGGASVANFHLRGQDIALDGALRFAAGRPAELDFHRFRLGGTDLAGMLFFPAFPGAPYVAEVAKGTLDLSARLKKTSQPGQAVSRRATEKAAARPPWRLHANLDRVVLAPPAENDQGQELTGIRLTASGRGSEVESADLAGFLAAGKKLTLSITPQPSSRAVVLTADDAGAVLRDLDLTTRVSGGQLAISGSFDDTQPDQPFSGEARIEDFRVRNAPVLGRLLQAMTLYGLVDVLQGPGLSFSNAILPFSYADGLLHLRQARAFSSSLGLTGEGEISLAAQRVAIQGTIVPAYFFNSLLGRIPLLGQLFIPEKGGGVFAASYRLSGPLAEPEISVNSLSALTPGFLRGIFGLFAPNETSPPPSQPPPPSSQPSLVPKKGR